MSRGLAIVVSGGTQVDIDDMRTITNRAHGKLGARIANLLAHYDMDVVLLGSEDLLRSTAEIDAHIHTVPFRTFDDLYTRLQELIFERRPDYIFMPAAISDYKPVKREGKISSRQDTIAISLQRTPKVISELREWCGIETFIVGWKLLSGVPKSELISAAQRQVAMCRTNLCVANDWKELQATPGYHPCYFVTPEGGSIRVEGTKEGVVESLVGFCFRRARTTWSRCSPVYPMPELREGKAVKAQAMANDLLQFAQQTGLLTENATGNVTATVPGTSYLWSSPRKVNKSKIKREDLVGVEVVGLDVRYPGPLKPSIDTSVHATLYRQRDDVKALLHFHDGYVIPDAQTYYPYPCGTQEEALEILDVVKDIHVPWMLELVHHGYLLAISKELDIRDLLGTWEHDVARWKLHLKDVGMESATEHATVSPVFKGATIVGLVARIKMDEDRYYHSVYLTPFHRGGGVGKQVAEMLIRAKKRVVVHQDCRVLEFYLNNGYKGEADTPRGASLLRKGVTFLEPPQAGT